MKPILSGKNVWMTKMQKRHPSGQGLTDGSYTVGVFSSEEYAKTAGRVEEGRRKHPEYQHDYKYVVTKVKLDELHVQWDIETIHRSFAK